MVYSLWWIKGGVQSVVDQRRCTVCGGSKAVYSLWWMKGGVQSVVDESLDTSIVTDQKFTSFRRAGYVSVFRWKTENVSL